MAGQAGRVTRAGQAGQASINADRVNCLPVETRLDFVIVINSGSFYGPGVG
ncbi:MAG TPA: hypothetical protein VLS89_00185 [Candidatus Nanopelagicales bacterium]|nr:hypothetical protein [Candidatus Nanopelagicales bacterium]